MHCHVPVDPLGIVSVEAGHKEYKLVANFVFKSQWLIWISIEKVPKGLKHRAQWAFMSH